MLKLKHAGGSLRIHRADLQRVLIDSMAGQLHLSYRLVSYEETDREIQLQFQDGKTASCDLLIGMDGIKSVVRKCFLIKQGLLDSPSIHPFWTGSFAYRGLVPIDRLEASYPGHRVFHTPMMVGQHYSSVRVTTHFIQWWLPVLWKIQGLSDLTGENG